MLIVGKSAQVLNINPLVLIVDDVFEQDLATHIIASAGKDFRRGRVITGAGANAVEESRTNEQSPVHQWADPRITSLVTDIADLVRLPPENSEPCQLLRYRGDQKFDPHADAFARNAGGLEALARGGQRLFTTLCYLNDVEEGGETEFPYLKLKVKPKVGRVLIFGNTRLGTADGHPHANHAGRTVEGGGEKYVLSIWWRQLAYHVQRDYPAEEGDVRTF